MSSAVVSTSAAQSRLFIFDVPEVPVGTAALGCPVERSSTAMHTAPHLPGIARHDSRGRLSLHEHVQLAITNQRFPSAHIAPASRLAIRPTPEMVPSGIAALDAMTGGLPRGCITEICGPVSSGRTSVLLASLGAATRRGECCALIDATDAFDPHSTTAAALDLDRLLWVRCGPSLSRVGRLRPPRDPKRSEEACESSPQRHRVKEKSFFSGKQKSNNELRRINSNGCPTPLSRFARKRVGNDSQPTQNFARSESEHRLEQVLRATDLLLESGGFGLIALDLADIPAESARRIPLTTWFRFRRAIEHTPTILLVIGPQPIAGSCSSLLLQLRSIKNSGASDNWKQPGSSREAAAWESPARQCRVEIENKNESRRDGIPDAVQITPTHTQLLTGLDIHAELIRSRHDRKPTHSVAFETRTAWAG